MDNLKILLKTLGYGFGALFVLVGLTGSPSAVALGLGLLALTLLASNAWGLRAHVRYFNSEKALHRRTAYAALIAAILIVYEILPTETPEARRAAAQAAAQATAQAHAQAQAEATQTVLAVRAQPTQTAQARGTAQAQAHAAATAAAVATHDALPTPTPRPLIVAAQTLVQQYDANKLVAQHRYTGRVVQTTGRIANISSSFGHPYLTLEPVQEGAFTLTSITCTFDSETPLLSLVKGQQVTVRGEMQDMFMTDIPLEHCALVTP